MTKPKKPKTEELDQFLSAPETIHKDKVERTKALQRKAQLAAKEARLAAEKSKAKPSNEDLLGDMVRVAEDKALNPWYKFRTLSRKRYWLYGHWPIKWVEERYGQFEHAKQVAGLADQPGTRLKKAARSEASKREHAARYITRWIRPHVLKDPSLTRTLKAAELWLIVSDTHATFLDPFTWQVFLAAIRDLKPDGVYLNGDILECQEISRFPKIPGWTCPLQLELDFAREMFRQVRAIGHEGPLVWGGGNHGIDRIAMYLTQVATGFASLRSLRFDELTELDGLNVTLAQGGTIASPKGAEDDRMGLLLHGFYRIHHGTLLGQNPAISELKAAGRSGTSGHAHRALLTYGANEALQGMSWMSTPAGCTERAARAYIKGINTGWQKGFGIVYLYPDGDVHQYPVITDRDRATVEGYIYERKPNLKDPDPSKFWIKDLPILD